jgi:hypothetical protein
MKELLLLLISLFIPFREDSYLKDHIINIENPPIYIYWISEDVVLLSYVNYAEIYNLRYRNRNKLEECSNCIYGYDKEIVKCFYEHRMIKSIDEFSTSITLLDSNENTLFKENLFPTVIPYICMKEYIYLRSAYTFLENKSYILNTQNRILSDYTEVPDEIIAKNDKWLLKINVEKLLYVYKSGN